ncbi:hypothetical protein C7446_2044 [Kushneria sinocarnis]|uniref:Uncharacterized protein n=1 Tax=Kushneria sinocarnis TaxID=595502 RepID=A0A420WWN4_9GAMM|nr:hypothetical protein [Kushneria sinocarnis]RKR03519.1 hypothetical protein C7446_2044 [Kushneria sinocarnis]
MKPRLIIVLIAAALIASVRRTLARRPRWRDRRPSRWQRSP